MKTGTYLVIGLVLLLGIGCHGQTPEQKEKAAEVEAMAVEMQRKADSMMNNPEMKKLMEQVQEIEAAQKVEEEKRFDKEKRTVEKKVSGEINTDHLKELFISRGTAKKFDNWQFGAADLYVLRVLPFGKDPNSQQKVGSINADGSFNLKMPNAVVLENEITEFPLFNCQGAQSSVQTEYSDPQAKVGLSSISVIKNRKSIGTIHLATSRQIVYNHSPYGEYRGELGYRLESWYADGPTSARIICKRTLNNYGDEVDIKNIYDLNFSKGWNLMKVEILEAHSPKNYKTKKYSIVPSMPQDVKWVFNHFEL